MAKSKKEKKLDRKKRLGELLEASKNVQDTLWKKSIDQPQSEVVSLAFISSPFFLWLLYSMEVDQTGFTEGSLPKHTLYPSPVPPLRRFQRVALCSI